MVRDHKDSLAGALLVYLHWNYPDPGLGDDQVLRRSGKSPPFKVPQPSTEVQTPTASRIEMQSLIRIYD